MAEMAVVGPIGPLLTRYNHIWVIKQFLEQPKNKWMRSPEFNVDNERYRLRVLQTDTDVRIYLRVFPRLSLPKTRLFSLSLVSQEGIIKEVCAKKEAIFVETSWTTADWNLENPDALFSLQNLSSDFLPNGQLKILCSCGSHDDEEKDLETSLPEKIESVVHQFYDFTLECGNQEIPVCRLLLAARSPVFCAMFSENFQEAKTGCAIITDVDHQSLQALVKFCHTNKLEKDDLTTNLLAAANKYMITELVEKCEEHLSKTMSVDNAIAYYLVARLHEANKLKTAAKKFITKNLGQVEKTEDYKDIGKEVLAEFLKYACQENL